MSWSTISYIILGRKDGPTATDLNVNMGKCKEKNMHETRVQGILVVKAHIFFQENEY